MPYLRAHQSSRLSSPCFSASCGQSPCDNRYSFDRALPLASFGYAPLRTSGQNPSIRSYGSFYTPEICSPQSDPIRVLPIQFGALQTFLAYLNHQRSVRILLLKLASYVQFSPSTHAGRDNQDRSLARQSGFSSALWFAALGTRCHAWCDN
ncbi:Uncharacterised protein [Vibrio cholerae]|nr:Uncharacterised protein [Vibrio cholerae]